MALNTSPPLTSGVVVLSGSEFFNPLAGSDFPVIKMALLDGQSLSSDAVLSDSTFILTKAPDVISTAVGSYTVKNLLISNAPPAEDNVEVFAKVIRITQDIRIRSTPVTTSGVVILDMFPDAEGEGEVFVPPVVINARIYPLYQGPIPSPAAGRIFPLLPQFSTLTPGD
jgi:hypothetical protein